MEIALALVGAFTPVLYGIASVAYLSLFLRDDGFSRRAAQPLLLAAIGVHLVEILLRGLQLGMLPIGNVFQLSGPPLPLFRDDGNPSGFQITSVTYTPLDPNRPR